MRFLKAAFSIERIIGLVLLVSLVFVYFLNPAPVNQLRLKTFDFYQQLKPREIPPPAGKPVTIIDLDEESLAEIGQWPWSRAIVAKLVRNVMQMGGALIAFDMVFAEPDRMNPNTIPDFVTGLIDTRGRGVVPDAQLDRAKADLTDHIDKPYLANRIAAFFLAHQEAPNV